MTYDFSLNPRAFAAMLAGSKRVEIRVKTAAEPFDYACLAAGDTLRFQNFESGERLAVTLTAAVHYPDIEALLAAEGTEYTLSSTNSDKLFSVKLFDRNSNIFAVGAQKLAANAISMARFAAFAARPFSP